MDKKDGKQNETFNQNETAMKKLKLRTLLSRCGLGRSGGWHGPDTQGARSPNAPLVG